MEIESGCDENVSRNILEKQDKFPYDKSEEVPHGKSIKNLNIEVDFPFYSFCNWYCTRENQAV